MLRIGHRGAKGYAAENTLDSFQKAIELGVDGVELDIQLSNDAIPVVIHDATVNRTSSAKGSVSDFSAVALQQLGIPTFLDVLEIIPDTIFINIEIKNPDAASLIVTIVERFKWHSRFQISSFDWSVLKKIKHHNPKLYLGVLTETNLNEAIDFAEHCGAAAVNPYFSLLHQENVTLLKTKGFDIFPWTVNESDSIAQMKRFGVTGIISDYPDRI